MKKAVSSLPEVLAVDQRTVDPVAQRCGEGCKAEHQAAIRRVPALLQHEKAQQQQICLCTVAEASCCSKFELEAQQNMAWAGPDFTGEQDRVEATRQKTPAGSVIVATVLFKDREVTASRAKQHQRNKGARFFFLRLQAKTPAKPSQTKPTPLGKTHTFSVPKNPRRQGKTHTCLHRAFLAPKTLVKAAAACLHLQRVRHQHQGEGAKERCRQRLLAFTGVI